MKVMMVQGEEENLTITWPESNVLDLIPPCLCLLLPFSLRGQQQRQ
jgi:hypothetical protein